MCAAMLGVGVLGTAVLHARAAHSTAHSFAPLRLHSVASVHALLSHRTASLHGPLSFSYSIASSHAPLSTPHHKGMQSQTPNRPLAMCSRV